MDVPELAEPADVERLSATFAAAFAADAMVRRPMPGASLAQVRAYFRALLVPYVELGIVWKLRGHAGGAAWLSPAMAERFAEIDQSARPEIAGLTSDGGARHAEFWDWLDSHLPADCWYLDMLAVRPGAQGGGLGRTLVRHGLGLAAADGKPAFLETGNPSNVAYYESLGFRLVDRQQAPDGGPTIWFMQTPPPSAPPR